MKNSTLRVALLVVLAASLVLPLVGSVLHFGGYPPGYGEFPAKQGIPVPGFVPWIFWVGVAIESVIALFFLFPRLFGFRKPEAPPRPTPTRFPAWFWAGLVLFVGCWAVYWAKVPFLDAVDPFMSSPLWWGFTLAVDGWAYRRSGGSSLVADRPKTVVLLALVSSVGWLAFEFLNFFVLEAWFYPYPVLTAYGNVVWFLICFTGIFPQLFVLYRLFLTFPRLSTRYSQGPRVNLPKWGYVAVLLLGAVTSFFMGFAPFEMFFVLWIAPTLMLWGVLGLAGTWTVFTPLQKGDWTPVMLTGIAMLICGLGWEMVNFGSEFFFHYQPVNPVYWKYSIPYVNSVHLPFSEMPILGYMGYIAYAWTCWLQWTAASKLFGFDPVIGPGKEGT